MGLEGLDRGAHPLAALLERYDGPGPMVGDGRPQGLLGLLGLEHRRAGDGGAVDGGHRAEGAAAVPPLAPPEVPDAVGTERLGGDGAAAVVDLGPARTRFDLKGRFGRHRVIVSRDDGLGRTRWDRVPLPWDSR